MLLLDLVLPFLDANATPGVNFSNSNSGTGTTLTCALAQGVAQYDVIVVAISGTQTVSTVTDSSSNTYTSQVSASLATGTVAANAYIYTAPANTVPARGTTLTITVTYSSSAKGAVSCYDTTGFSQTQASTSTGTGTFNAGNSFSPAVGSYTPTAGNFEISVFAGSTCGAPATITVPASPSGSTTFPIGISTGTSCKAAPSTNFQFVAGSAYFLSHSGAAVTDGYTATGTQTVGTNSANWAEVAAEFTAKTTLSQSLTETNSLGVVAQLYQAALTETNSLGSIQQLRQASLQETNAMSSIQQLGQAFNIEQICLGVQITINGLQTLDTGANCEGLTITIIPCSWFQVQCWWYPSLFFGLYIAIFMIVAKKGEASGSGTIYMALSALNLSAMTQTLMGLLTFIVPLLLIVLTVVYAVRFRGG